MANYKVTSEYSDKTKRMLETSDGKMAMMEVGNMMHEEDMDKMVMLEKDGEVIHKEKVKANKPEGMAKG